MTQVRIERDLLGDREVPAEAYYGVHTLRAQENFRITGITIASFPELVIAMASVKQAAAEANTELGLLAPSLRDAIVAACKEIRGGALHDQFVVDVIQGGAGTSTNMNANEVICNRALELLGHRRVEYQHLHPNEHVNMAQSTNDVYPTAIRIATCFAIERLLQAMEHLRAAFAAKSVEFAGLMKIGRTQLQDAVPMTLGQEFSTYDVMLGEDILRLTEASALIREINLGATAIGTVIPEGVNQVAFEVFGNDLTVTFAAEAGQLQLNAFEPIIFNALHKSFKHLTNACTTLADRCIVDITANPDRLRYSIERSISLVTALNPFIGYAAATSVAAEAFANGGQRARGRAGTRLDDRHRARRCLAARGAHAATQVRDRTALALTASCGTRRSGSYRRSTPSTEGIAR